MAAGDMLKRHVVVEGRSACGSQDLRLAVPVLAKHIPELFRCRKNGCRQLWPDYRKPGDTTVIGKAEP